MSETVRTGLRVLQSFISKVKLKHGDIEMSLDVAPEKGVADSGDLEADLPELMLAVGNAAAGRNTAAVIIFDEMQYLSRTDLSALIMAMHKVSQRKLPILLMGAGLPPLLGHMGNSKSYSERLFDYPSIGPLDRKAVEQAVQRPVEKAKVFIERRAIDHIFNASEGYPFFVQQWAHDAWNCAKGSNIDLRAAQNADSEAKRNLDEGFFAVRFDRLTIAEKNYLRAMAFFQASSVKSGKIAAAMGQKVESANSIRTSLIKKGMVYGPRYGETAFTVPMFDQYMRRKMPQWSPKS